MYAVFKTGGKQYKVSAEQILTVEKLEGKIGDTVIFDQVLLAHDGKSAKVGSPLLSNAAISAEIIDQARSAKILVFKKKRRQNYRRLKGHRQEQTVLRIMDISLTGSPKTTPSSRPKKAEAPKANEAAKPELKETVKKATEAKVPAKKTETKAAEKPAAKKATESKAAKKTEAKKPAAKKETAAKKPAAKKDSKKEK